MVDDVDMEEDAMTGDVSAWSPLSWLGKVV
jgi:hypothetical protein